jgi:hypothetical protein
MSISDEGYTNILLSKCLSSGRTNSSPYSDEVNKLNASFADYACAYYTIMHVIYRHRQFWDLHLGTSIFMISLHSVDV